MTTTPSPSPALVGSKAAPVPMALLQSSSTTKNADDDHNNIDPKLTPDIETYHVRDVYDRVATQWAGTRYKAWPEVEKFLTQYATRSTLVCEVGCGNGKNLECAVKCTGSKNIVIASDSSLPLCEIAQLQTKLAEVQTADIVDLPYRDGMFDILLCVAVLHHISTPQRRELAVRECARICAVGAKLFFLAWAQEQNDGVSGHEFPTQDVFVPFHQRSYVPGFDPHVFLPARVDESIGHGVIDKEKRAVVFQRYCHVFREGDLQALIASVPDLHVDCVFRDAGNWAVIATKR